MIKPVDSSSYFLQVGNLSSWDGACAELAEKGVWFDGPRNQRGSQSYRPIVLVQRGLAWWWRENFSLTIVPRVSET
jgi:hypothetical protein